MNERLTSDFIERAKKMMEPLVEEVINERREKRKEYNEKNYERIRERKKIREEKFKDSTYFCGWHEKKLIREFYKNCPEGYEVDHIVPLSKGGIHVLSNLQYLTRQENREKSDKLFDQELLAVLRKKVNEWNSD